MQGLVKSRFYGFLVLLDPLLMRLDLFPGSAVKLLMACEGDLALVPRPSLHHEVLFDGVFPKRVVFGDQPETAFRLGDDVIAVDGAAEGASGPVITHDFDVGVHKGLVESGTVAACGVQTTLTRSKHVDIKVEITKKVITCRPHPQSRAAQPIRHLPFIRIHI